MRVRSSPSTPDLPDTLVRWAVSTSDGTTTVRQVARKAASGKTSVAETSSAPVRRVDPAIVSVKNEESLNLLSSPGGAVVGLLSKGEIVELQYEVNHSGRRWALIKVPQQNLSGYVQFDSLEVAIR
jgi:hypothetical protein